MIFIFLLPQTFFAKTFGQGMRHMTQNMMPFTEFFVGIAFLCGVGFGVAAIFKFKQHKDNPQQNTIGTPITMLALSVALVFLPGFYHPMGRTMFGLDYDQRIKHMVGINKRKSDRDYFLY